jgi:hypothetical protein
MIKFFFKDKQYKKPCPNPCAPLKWINGNVARREPLVDDLKKKMPVSRDYNEVLAELIEDRATAMDKILQIEDPKRRAIGAMLLARLKHKEIATLLSMSPRQIIRIVKHHP